VSSGANGNGNGNGGAGPLGAARWLARALRERPWAEGAGATSVERAAAARTGVAADPSPAPRGGRADVFLLKTPPWDTRLPPLGIGYLAAYLEKHGRKATVWDCNVDTFLRFRMDRADLWNMDAAVFWFTPDKVAEVFNHECDIVARRIVEADTPYVGFSLTMEGILFAKLVLDRVRRDAPEKIVLMGGPGVAFPEYRALFPRGSVDLFVVGVGEEALRLVLLHGIGPRGTMRSKPPESLKIWKDRPEDPDCPVCVSHPLEPEEFEHPTFDGYDLCKYRGRDHIALIMGRGCFRSCAFCSDKPDQGAYRSFGFEKTMRAIAYYKERYWLGGITWNDLILNGDLKHLDRYCDVLIENRVDLVWDGQATAHRVMNKQPWLFEKMAKAGCTDLTYGVESFDDGVLALMRKGYVEEVAVETLKRTKAAGITTGINLICGFPGETEAQFQHTLDALERHRPWIDRVTSLSVCAVMPGSPLWTEAGKFGIGLPPPGHYHEWQTDDGTNTLDLRLERHARMKEKVRGLGLSAVVQKAEDFVTEELRAARSAVSAGPGREPRAEP
jgi:hypothetical protein